MDMRTQGRQLAANLTATVSILSIGITGVASLILWGATGSHTTASSSSTSSNVAPPSSGDDGGQGDGGQSDGGQTNGVQTNGGGGAVVNQSTGSAPVVQSAGS